MAFTQRYRLCILFFSLFAGTLLTSAAQEQWQEIAVPIAFYNVENLFDTIDQENNDSEFLPEGSNRWTPERYQHKLHNLARVISEIGGHGPAILGLGEVENRGVIEDLIREPELAPLGYEIIHYDSPDLRGIDCAILYRPETFKLFSSGARPVFIPEDPEIKTRDIVYASGTIEGEIVHILVGHWPSRSGGESASIHRRMAAAKTMRSVADSLYSLFPGSKVIMMGDFNDDPISPSVRKGLGIVERADQVAPDQYFSPMLELYNRGQGTLAYRDVWNLFDIMVVNGELLSSSPTSLHLYQDLTTGDRAFIYKKPFMIQQSGQYKGYTYRTFVGGEFQGGYSDHCPVYLYLVKTIRK